MQATLGQPALAIEAELRRRLAADPNNAPLL